MEKTNNILKEYYTYSFLRKNNFKERFFNFFKRRNFFGIMNEDIECLELSQRVLDSLNPNQTIDNDQWLQRARASLVNALVFYLYFKRTPEDFDFVRIVQLLEKTKTEATLKEYPYTLSLLYAKKGAKEPKHTGWRELEVFNETPSEAAYTVVDDVLQNFKSPAECKQLFQRLYNDTQK